MFVFKAGVVGGGVEGGEIAQAIAAAGIPVLLKDADSEGVEAGLARAREVSEKAARRLVEKGKLSGEAAGAQVEQIVGLITGTTGYEGFGDVDFAIEAVPEQLELKHRAFADLDAATPGHAILASSTGTLSITEIGEITLRPDQVVGFHLVGPRLVEIVEGDDTSPETTQAAANFAQRLRKTPIRAAECPGLVVERVTAAAAVETGASAERLADAYGDRFQPPGDLADDTAAERSELKAFVESCLVLEEAVAGLRDIDMGLMLGAGIAPGPFVRADLRGLDEVLTALERAEDAWGERFEPPLILRRLVSQGRLGAKSGQGFYPYPQIEAGYEDAPVKLDVRGDVAIVWLDNPPANSLSPDVIEALARAWGDVVERGARAMILASPNPALFCAGADIKAFTKWDVDSGRMHLERIHALGREWERSRVTTIAAVNGLAFGGGCEIAMACDVRLAARSATFGQPEVNLGIIPGFGGTQRLARLVGPAKALEMNTVGDPVSAEEAYEYGLVNRVVEDHELFDLALAWGRKLAGQAPIAIEQIKRVSHAADLDAGLAAERDAFLHAFASEDAREGIAAFIEKRAPEFKGQVSAERLAELIVSSGPVVVLTGAGISVPSGIPDFRTPMTGLWANVDPMEVAHISVWRRDPERFWSFYGQRFAILDGKEPNGAHRAVAELQRRGLVSGVITQNIDGLHALAGSDPIEVHGSIRTASCLECGASYSLAETRARGDVPLCDCGAVLKPDVVLFGEMLPERAMMRASLLASSAGLMLAIGSSLEVWPVAGLPEETLNAGGKLAIVTIGETPYDEVADVKLSGDVVAELEAVVALLGGVDGAGADRGLEP